VWFWAVGTGATSLILGFFGAMTKSAHAVCAFLCEPVSLCHAGAMTDLARRTSDTTGATSRALAAQRHDIITAQLRLHGAVRVGDLAALLEVSEMTVRRDLDVLSELGVLDKVHGGATLRDDRSAFEPGFDAKSRRNLEEKVAIGREAATIVRPGTSIGLTAGTTTYHMAMSLIDVTELTVVTNCIHIAEYLHQFPRSDRTVLLVGGTRTPSDALVGPTAVQTLSQLQLDVVFMGVHGMSAKGFTTPNLAEAETNRSFANTTNDVVILADHAKWNLNGLCTIMPLSGAAMVITDSALRQDARAVLADQCRSLRIVETSSTDTDASASTVVGASRVTT
jgi:DeoR/GlpR family transcriptional regulator of sugar metabolism